MGIDPMTEQPTRKLLGHAIRHELDELAATAQSQDTEALIGSIPLCLLASAYVASDVSDRWPTEADLREIAKSAAESVTRLDITEQEIYAYLSRVGLGPEKLNDVFSVEGLATIPMFATANLLLTFCPQEKDWSEYLDQIWTQPKPLSASASQSSRPSCSAHASIPLASTTAGELSTGRPSPRGVKVRECPPARKAHRLPNIGQAPSRLCYTKLKRGLSFSACSLSAG